MAKFSYIPNRVIDTNGISDGANIYFYTPGTTTPVTIYSDAGFTTPVSNPYPVSSGAAVPALYHNESGGVRVKVVDSSGNTVSDDDPWSAFAADVVRTATGDDLQDTLDGYATRTALKAITSYAGARAYLTEAGREGEFIFRTGDYSTEITADTQEGLYIKADDMASTAGAWVRKFEGPIDVRFFGAKGDGTTDDTAAINAAIAAAPSDPSIGARIYFPPGQYLTDGGHEVTVTGTQIVGAGIDATRILFAPASTETGAFILGNKSTATITKHLALKNMRIEMQGASKYGIEMYGCRDGSEAANIYISDFAGGAVRLNMAGNGTGSATGKMNQGVKFNQVICETSRDVTAADGVFDIDGTFESTFDTCAFKGASAATNNAKGFVIGHEGECRNVVMQNTAIPHLRNAGAGGNVGIHYGQWARECRDIFTTFENIDGNAVLFDGSNTSGANLPFMCYSLYPRLYQVATAGVLDPAFSFGDAASCYVGPITTYQTSKTWVEFAAFSTFQTHNKAEVMGGGVAPASLVSSSNVTFDASTPSTNLVEGTSSNDTNLRPFIINNSGVFVDYFPNGTTHTTSSTYDTFALAGSGGVRWQASGNSLAEFSPSVGSGQTALLLRYDATAGVTTARVTVGAADSGGVGFRQLLVAN